MTLPSTTMDGMTGIMQVVPDVIMTTYIWVKITITVSPIIRKKLYTGVKTGQSDTPPRLQLIREDILKSGKMNSWEADDYLQWYDAYDRFLKEKGFDKASPRMWT